jgi:predicted nucleic acid-binding protein
MIAVLDASAAIDVILKKEAYEVFCAGIEKADVIIAPEIYISEIANVAWKYHKLAKFSHEESVSLAEDGILIIDKYIPVIGLWKEALRESISNDHSVYDLLYIVCARRNDGILLTKDKRLISLCNKLEIQTINSSEDFC